MEALIQRIKANEKVAWLVVLTAIFFLTFLASAKVVWSVAAILTGGTWVLYIQETYGNTIMSWLSSEGPKEVTHGRTEPEVSDDD